jgi:tRNA modification GTPase
VNDGSDRIVAVSTAVGRAAIGVVRLSGPGTLRSLEQLTGVPRGKPRRPTVRTLYDPADGTPLDRAVVWWAPAPGTYTGEDLAELQTHGNPVILDALVDACCRLGARTAEPGEFTRRALLNGRMDLAGAEAVLAATEARTVAGVRLATRVLTGELGDRVEGMRRQLLALAATVEAAVDFPEQVEELEERELMGELHRLEQELRGMGERVREAGRLMWGADVAILGPTNAGKSTLFNRLVGEERAIVDPEPGTTRDVITGEREVRGVRIRFHDTAGFRDRGAAVEDEGMRRATALRGQVDGVLYVVDATVEGLAQSGTAWSGTPGSGRPEPGDIVVINKTDLRPSRGNDGEGWSVSARTGEGIQALVDHLLTQLVGAETPTALIWTARQGMATRSAAARLEAARFALGSAEYGPAAADIGDALRGLQELLGVDAGEAVLDELFARFCIGK